MNVSAFKLAALIISVSPVLASAQLTESVAERTLSNPVARWIHRRTANADIYVLTGSAAQPMLRTIALEAERAISANLEWLGERNAKERLTLFFVGS